MTTPLNRRSFLKLGAASLLSLAARPLNHTARIAPPSKDQAYPLGIGRIAADLVYVYAEPTTKSQRVGSRRRDRLVSILEEVTAEGGPSFNPRWYRLVNGFAHSAYIQRIDLHPPNPVVTEIPEQGLLSEVTAPYTRTFRQLRTGRWERLYRLYHHSLHWITGLDEGPDGRPWYRLRDHLVGVDYHAPADGLRPVYPEDYAPLSPDMPPEHKRIQISISQQKLAALEDGQVVKEFRVATGVRSPEKIPPGELPTDTPLGRFRIQTKMPSRHMGDGKLTDQIDAYELPGVPWTMLFTEEGVGMHGTYWHDNFGVRMSHGCVNLRNDDALWLFRWTDPVFEGNDYYTRQPGTTIDIYD